MLRSSPYQVNDVYEEGWTISNVQVMYTQSRGWVWVIDLQDADENVLRDWRFLTTYKNPPSPEPRRMSCEHCFYSDEDDDVRVIPAQTAYHWVPGEENPNRPLLLCAVCAADYMSYWKERWDEYYAGLI